MRNFDRLLQPDSRAVQWGQLRERIRIIARRHIGRLNRALNLDSTVRDIVAYVMKKITPEKSRLLKDPPTLSDEEILSRVKKGLGETRDIWD